MTQAFRVLAPDGREAIAQVDDEAAFQQEVAANQWQVEPVQVFTVRDPASPGALREATVPVPLLAGFLEEAKAKKWQVKQTLPVPQVDASLAGALPGAVGEDLARKFQAGREALGEGLLALTGQGTEGTETTQGGVARAVEALANRLKSTEVEGALQAGAIDAATGGPNLELARRDPGPDVNRKDPKALLAGVGAAKGGLTTQQGIGAAMEALATAAAKADDAIKDNPLGRLMSEPSRRRGEPDAAPIVTENLKTSGNWLYQDAKAKSEALEKQFPGGDVTKRPELLKDPRYWAQTIPETAVQFSQALVMGGGTATAGAVLGAVQEAAPMFKDLKAEGKSDNEALAKTAAYSAVVAGLNKIGLDKLFAPADLVGKGITREILEKALTETVTEYLEEPSDEAIRHIENLGLQPSKYFRDVLDAAVQGLNVIPGTLVVGALMGGGEVASQRAHQSELDAMAADRDARREWQGARAQADTRNEQAERQRAARVELDDMMSARARQVGEAETLRQAQGRGTEGTETTQGTQTGDTTAELTRKDYRPLSVPSSGAEMTDAQLRDELLMAGLPAADLARMKRPELVRLVDDALQLRDRAPAVPGARPENELAGTAAQPEAAPAGAGRGFLPPPATDTAPRPGSLEGEGAEGERDGRDQGDQSVPPAVEPPAPMQEIVPRVEKKRRAQVNFADPIEAAIIELGGLRHYKVDPGSGKRPWMEENKRLLRMMRAGERPMDQLVEGLKEMRAIPQEWTENDVYDYLLRRKPRQMNEDEAWKAKEQEYDDWVATGSDVIHVGQLKQGASFTIMGEEFEVVEEADTALKIKDGTEFWIPYEGDADARSVRIDKGSLVGERQEGRDEGDVGDAKDQSAAPRPELAAEDNAVLLSPVADRAVQVDNFKDIQRAAEDELDRLLGEGNKVAEEKRQWGTPDLGAGRKSELGPFGQNIKNMAEMPLPPANTGTAEGLATRNAIRRAKEMLQDVRDGKLGEEDAYKLLQKEQGKTLSFVEKRKGKPQGRQIDMFGADDSELEFGAAAVDLSRRDSKIPSLEEQTVEQAARWLAAGDGAADLDRDRAVARLRSRFGARLERILDKIWERADTIIRNRELVYEREVKQGSEGQKPGQDRQAPPVRDDAAGPGQADPGAAGGRHLAGGRRRDLRVAGGFVQRPPDRLGAGRYGLDEDQRLGVNLMLERFLGKTRGEGFLLADGTGVGKTRQILAAAQEFLAARPGAKILIVTLNDKIVRLNFAKDAKAMGLDLNAFDVSTYPNVKLNKALHQVTAEGYEKRPMQEAYDLVIFDEAHALKNLSSQRALAGHKLIENAKHVVFATATPMDRPSGAAYFLHKITGIPQRNVMLQMGVVIDEKTKTMRPKEGLSWKQVLQNLARLRNVAVKLGAMVRREYPFFGTIQDDVIALSPEIQAQQARIVDYYSELSRKVGRVWAGQRTQASRHALEQFKVTRALELMDKELSEGRQVILGAAFIKPSERLFRPEPTVGEDGKVDDRKGEIWDKYFDEPELIPGTIQMLEKELEKRGIDFAQVYGGGDNSGEVSRFQRGDSKVLVMTPESGGTGIDLDDQKGGAPRTMILLSVVFGGDMTQQIVGRISRRNTQTPAKLIMLYVDGAPGDEVPRTINKAKLQALQAIQEGGDLDLAGAKTDEEQEKLDEMERELGVGEPAARGEGTKGTERTLADPEADAGEGFPGAPLQEPWTAEQEQKLDAQEREKTFWPLELPELVRLAREILGGKYPEVRKKLRALGGGAMGVFRMREGDRESGQIHLLARTAELVSRAERARLMEKAKRWVEENLPKPEQTQERISRVYQDEYDLALEAAMQKQPRLASKVLAHEIMHAVDVLPDYLMPKGSILAHIAAFQREFRKTVLPFSQVSQDDAEDLLGKDERAELHKEAVRWATAMKIPTADKPAAIAQKYQELLKARMDELGLVSRAEVVAELTPLIAWWRGTGAEMEEYFEQPEEMFAEAGSILLNNPDALAKRAPKFWKALFGWAGARTEFFHTYAAFQAQIRADQLGAEREAELMKGVTQAEQIRKEALEEKKLKWSHFWLDLQTALIDRFSPVYRWLHSFGEQRVDPAKNPRYRIEDMLYAGAAHEAYIKRFEYDVARRIRGAGLNLDDMHMVMFLRRVMGERKDLFNPGGMTPVSAKQMMGELEERWGKERMGELQEAIAAFRKIRQKQVLLPAAQAGLWSKELFEKIVENEDYATFNVVQYLQEHFGQGPSAHIYRQIGTLKPIENVVIATMRKDLAIISSLLRNQAMRSAVTFMRENFPEEIEPAKQRWNGQRLEAVEPARGSGKGLVGYLAGGRFYGFWVDERWANSWQTRDPLELANLARAWSATNALFREVFTQGNPAFWLWNIQRDFRGAVRRLPQASMGLGKRKFLKYWLKAWAPAFRRFAGLDDRQVEEALEGKMLISVANAQALRGADSEYERLLVKAQLDPATQRREIHGALDAAKYVAQAAGRVWEGWLHWGNFLSGETTTKLAAKAYLEAEFPDMDAEQVAHIVRQAGSPMFLRKGTANWALNNIALFWNAAKEGWRTEAEMLRNPVSRGEWWRKMMTYGVLPKAFQWALSRGLVGGGLVMLGQAIRGAGDDDEPDKLEELGVTLNQLYAQIGEWDLVNYLCLPVGLTDDGKTVYIPLPQDETTRVVSGSLFRALDMAFQKTDNDMERLLAAGKAGGYIAGEVPNLSPPITIALDSILYASGVNPADWQTGQELLPDTLFETRTAEAHRELAKQLANEAGIGIVYRFPKVRSNEEAASLLEQATRFPIVGTPLSRLVRVSDKGIHDEAKLAAGAARVTEARKTWAAGGVARKLAAGEALEAQELATLVEKADYVGSQLETILARRYSSGWVEELLLARTKAEREAIAKQMIEWERRIKVKGNGTDGK